MVSIVTLQDVKIRMMFGNTPPDSDPVIESALSASHLRIEAELETKFDKGAKEDVFFLDDTMTGGLVPNGLFRLRLSRGFVRESPAIVVTCGDTLEAQEEAVTGFKLDAARGWLSVPESYKGKFVKADYDYGFDAADQTPPPEAVKEAILQYLPVVIDMNTSDTKKKVNEAYKSAIAHCRAVLAAYNRTWSICLLPVY